MTKSVRTMLKGGRVVDPVNGVDGSADVLIDQGRVTRVGPDLAIEPGIVVIDVPPGCVVCPGFIDMHVHLREPGHEHKETVATGVAAAVAGGFTAVACMPNTDPVNDDAGITRLILGKAAEAGLARVYPVGAVTKGQAGEQLAEIGELRAAGCVAVSDDGRPVASASVMRRALEYAAMFDMPVIDHCEDASLMGDGVAHEGHQAAVLGLRGVPAAAEEIVVARDVTLSGLTGSPVHIAHMSARGALRAVRSGKERGIRVSCEVTPHHFTLTDERLAGYDTNFKMNPPLRETADVEALLDGLRDGTIDCIATDHAPHHYDEKLVEFDRAPFGIVGLETAVSICLDRLVHAGQVSLSRLVELLAVNPARILGVPGGDLAAGALADVTVLAPELAVTVEAAAFRSLARNTPFDGWRLRGGVAATMIGGRTVYVNEAVAGASAFEQPA
ncbi:MAG: dihydroorotase [Vicinamibacterales bacterium]|nr:dihydroorotase [Vicinamibacterales bacterium]MDP7479788.1 dihydroorotase [Vicinamibacterales bacterium]MDP7691257.1 dihydroorotase [Vicinamibacterales bacterium]HJN45599.1 dihydroorotase [Vicinamibacterales bacterium]